MIFMQRMMPKHIRVFNFFRSVGKYNEPRLIRIEKNRDSQEMIKSGSLVSRVKVFKRPVVSGIWHIPNSLYHEWHVWMNDTNLFQFSIREIRLNVLFVIYKHLKSHLKSLENTGFPIVSGGHP